MLINFLDKWSRHQRVLKGLTPQSVESYRVKVLDFFSWLKSEGRWTSIEDTSRKDIEDWLEYLYFSLKNGNYTRVTKLGAVSAFFRFLRYEGIVKKDITEGIPRPRITKRLMQDFSRAETIRIFKTLNLNSEKGLRDACILILLSFAGLRAGETCSLRLHDILDDGKYILVQIPEDIGKQGSSRTIDLWQAPSMFLRRLVSLRISQGASSTSRLIVSYKKGDSVIGNPLSPKDLDRFVKAVTSAAGLRKSRHHAHMFRAMHASDLRHIKGYDIGAIAARLGHRSISTTDRYMHRGRITQYYRSLREYWIEWEKIWTEGGGHDAEI